MDGKRLVVRRRRVQDIPWQTSVQYMKSAAYRQMETSQCGCHTNATSGGSLYHENR